jgi:hypothetical protein
LTWQTKGALAVVALNLADAAKNLTAATLDKAVGFVKAAQEATQAAVLNTATMLKVQGEPKEKKGFSGEASEAARKAAEEAVPWYERWYAGAAAALTAVLAVAKIVGRFAPGIVAMIPGFGNAAAAVTWALGLVGALKTAAASAPGNALHINGLAAVALEHLDKAPAFVKKLVGDKLEEPSG